MYTYKVDDIIDAYKKLKSYIFYSTNSIKYKILISDFEWGNFEKKFINITNSLNGKDDYLEKKLEEIKYYTLPKSFEDKDDFTSFLFISNKNLSTEYKVTKTTKFIDCPAELLIISMLWVLKIGVILESEVSEFCYANRLVMNEDSTINSWQFITFEKYYIAYSNWRDLAIKKARTLHEDNQNALIINLDIKDYFNQIDINIEGLKNVPKDHLILNRYLTKIHKKYKEIRKSKKNILPIGLPSSNILSNIYLNDLDESISSISPSYYGRYVDDMLIVLPQKINEKDPKKTIHTILEKIGMKHSSKDNSFHFKIDENNLEVQDQKLKVLYFEKDEPITLLEEFERKIIQNSSEFRFLPEEDEISKSIDRQFYDLLYSDNVNKIRSLEGFKTNKYGVSKTLSKLLALVNDVHGITKHYKEDILQRIRAFFAGARAIDLIIYSEKALTYYAFIDSLQEFYNMFESILNSIFITSVYVNGEKNEEETIDLRKTLVDHLFYSMSFAASYNPAFVDPVEFEKRKKEIGYKKGTELLKYLNYTILQKNMKRITKANMMRHNLIKIPLSNYLSDTSFHNIMNGKLDVESDKFDEHKIKFSPRFIHRGEIQLFYDLQQFFSDSNKPDDNVKKISDRITADFKEFNSLSPDYVENDPIVEVLND